MKKTYHYIIAVAIVLTGMLQLVSCKDSNNDWTVDTSVLKQRPPSSLTVEVDSASLDMTVQIGTIAKAASYELQISESPLTSNANMEVEGDIYTFSNITESQFVNGAITIAHQNEQFEVKGNTTYYFRVRAIGTNGTVSNWYTNGMLYNGGFGDEVVAERMKANTYYTLTTPAILSVDENDIDPDALTLRWYVVSYANIATLRCETTGTEVPASAGTQDPNYTDVEVWYYKWTGLEANKSYTFSLLDDAGNVLATSTQSTEFAPNMELAHSILSWTKDDVIGAKGESKVLYDPDNYFCVTFNEESAANAGYKSDGSYWCQTPEKKAYKSPYRVQVKNTNTLEFKVPENGRMYLYGNGSPTPYELSMYMGLDDDGNDVWEVIQTVTINKDEKVKAEDEDGKERDCYRFTKLKLNGAVDGRYKFAPTASKSCYYYGFVFVPDDPNAQ